MSHHRPASKHYCLTLCYTLMLLIAGPQSRFWPQINSCDAMEEVLLPGSARHEGPTSAAISSEYLSQNEKDIASLFPDNLDLAYDDVASIPASTADSGSTAFLTNPVSQDMSLTTLPTVKIKATNINFPSRVDDAHGITDGPDSNAEYAQKLLKNGLNHLQVALTKLPSKRKQGNVAWAQCQAKILLKQVLDSTQRLAVIGPNNLNAIFLLDSILQKLELCLSTLRKVATSHKCWQKDHELLVFNGLLYLFEKDLVYHNKIIAFLRNDGVMYHTAIHTNNIMGPLEIFNGHELQESWKETLRTHTKLGHMRGFLDMFNKDAWSHLLCYFLNHHYTKKQIHEHGSNKERFHKILKRLGTLRYGKLPDTPTEQLIDEGFMLDIIELFDWPLATESKWIKNDVECYIATYHLLDYVLQYAHPEMTRYLILAQLLTDRILSKRESIRRILNLAERLRKHHFQIKTAKKFEQNLEPHEDPTQIDKSIEILEETQGKLDLEAHHNFSTLRNVPPPSDKEDHELKAWLNSSDMILYLLKNLKHQVYLCRKDLKNYHKMRRAREESESRERTTS